jgi:hypothetical protein
MNKFSREPGMSRHAHSRYIHFGTGNKNNLGNSKEARKSHIEEISDDLRTDVSSNKFKYMYSKSIESL